MTSPAQYLADQLHGVRADRDEWKTRALAAEADRDVWRERFESAWADMRAAVAAGPEAERDEARAEVERLREALNDATDTLYSICRGCFGPVIVREIQPVLDRARAALAPVPHEGDD